ncbi:MAG TPA: hypothetical protein PLQ76_06970, partial [bacterium]|nr:hypothetical protein [bacterium]
MKNNSRKNGIFIMVVACVFIVACAGCGGGKVKSGAGGAASGAAMINGTVDLYGGYGAEIDGAGRAAALRDAAVRLYRVKPDGSGLEPLADSATATVKNGAFSLSGVPTGERNLIVRIESKDAKTFLSAIVAPTSPGENRVVVTPETDVETRVLMSMVKTGVRAAKDVKPADIDASFIKAIVGPELFFRSGAVADDAVVAEAVAPFARAAYAKFSNMLNRGDKAVNDAALKTVLSGSAGALMKMEIALDMGKPIDGPESDELSDTVARAAKSAGLGMGTMSPSEAWFAARSAALLWAAACMSGTNGAKGCPETKGDFNVRDYGVSLSETLKSRFAAGD